MIKLHRYTDENIYLIRANISPHVDTFFQHVTTCN